ncbi:MAG: formylmethanofuran dehydrogenase subunit A [Planctomycetota bacterium]|jgi:formylmethanofuran dehydrogenase subunit A|nr:formylmethanofuran dehydrogenase subunit A [Planctomycetota bacterium]
MSLIKIAGGSIYDPLNEVDGVVSDIWVRDGKVIAAPPDGTKADKVIDANGLVVMPGGVDMHCHIAGPKVNVARKLRPEERRLAEKVERTPNTRSGTMGSVPSTFATGYKYAGLGYTTAFDAAIPPLGARHAHEEFHDTPVIDKGFFVLMGNNHFVMQQIKDNEPEKLKGYVAWLLAAAKGYAVKAVNPGGVEEWKSGGPKITNIDDTVDHFEVTPRQILCALAEAATELKLPHRLHVHCNNLGLPGNWATTLDTMQAIEDRKAHLTHIQFHSYAGGDADEETFGSRVPQLVEYVNAHPNLTLDVGQVMFGQTTSMTGDGPLGYYLHQVTGRKWFSSDTEQEAGCGIVPIEYKNKSFIHAMQWAIGLEWFLLADDPWQVVMSTDHPNGGSFMAYPQIIHLLMDSGYRKDICKTVHKKVLERSMLGKISREYSLYEIAIITRAGPAKILGLKDKGHLGPGADADITIYTPQKDITEMFSIPRVVIKSGELLVEEGHIRQDFTGKTFYVSPSYDDGLVADIREWFDRMYTIQFENYPVDEHYMPRRECVASNA